MNLKSGIRSILILAIIVILQSPTAWASNKRKQAQAKAMFHAAYAASGIKTKSSPPFRLKAEFQFYGNFFKVSHGTFDELWVSDKQRRVSYVTPSARDVYGASNGHLWRKANPPYTTFTERLVKDAMSWDQDLEIGRPYKIKRFKEVVSGTRPMTCVIPHDKWADTFCFNPRNGRLVQWTQPYWMSTYEYSDYRPWGRKWFPGKITVVQSGTPMIQITVKSVAPAGRLSASDFAPPAGADLRKQLTCPGYKGGYIIKKVQPGYPRSASQRGYGGTVRLYVYVGEKGHVHGAQVTQSVSPFLDASAIRAVQKWRYKPLTCSGVPMGFAMPVSVHFSP